MSKMCQKSWFSGNGSERRAVNKFECIETLFAILYMYVYLLCNWLFHLLHYCDWPE